MKTIAQNTFIGEKLEINLDKQANFEINSHPNPRKKIKIPHFNILLNANEIRIKWIIFPLFLSPLTTILQPQNINMLALQIFEYNDISFFISIEVMPDFLIKIDSKVHWVKCDLTKKEKIVPKSIIFTIIWHFKNMCLKSYLLSKIV